MSHNRTNTPDLLENLNLVERINAAVPSLLKVNDGGVLRGKNSTKSSFPLLLNKHLPLHHLIPPNRDFPLDRMTPNRAFTVI